MTANLFDLSGQVAIVTGSSMGLGEATAKVLAEHGAHVIISSRKQDQCDAVASQFRDAGLSAEGFACDIGKQADIDAIYEHVGSTHGRLDLLVNNAVMSPWRSIEETDRALMLKALETNMAGYWFMSTGAVKLMKQAGKGSIVNISSMVARRPSPNLGLYATFKSSIDGMTQSFAQEFGPDGIRVNTILPGLFETKLSEAFSPKEKQDLKAKLPLRRLGEPSEIGGTVLFLASDASGYITGASIVVDGGSLLTG